MTWDLFRRKRDKWLLVFAGCTQYDANIIERCLLKASEIIKHSIPAYEIKCIEREETKKIALSTSESANEIHESFSEFILNDVINWKKECAATQVAIILPSRAFTHEDTFVHILADLIFTESNYHAVCYSGSFIDATVRRSCMDTVCTQCKKLAEGCEHSCLLWLIWMMFDRKHEQIFSLFDGWNPE